MYLFAKQEENTQNTYTNLLSYKIGLIVNTIAMHNWRHREKEEQKKESHKETENLRKMEKGGKGKEGRKQERELICWNFLQTERPSAFYFLAHRNRLPLLVPIFCI